MTQSDVCDLTSINRRTQSNYEHDVSYPDAAYLMTLLGHGFDVLYLLGGEESPRNGSIDEGLLRTVLTAVDEAARCASCDMSIEKKAIAVSLVYQASQLRGAVDGDLVKKAIRLAM